ncbi:MAG: DUF6434 domain-containing protein [Sneathiella sp.]
MNNSAELRPKISDIGSGAELKRWYWLKMELSLHAKKIKVKSTGAKFDILERIAYFLDTGKTEWLGDSTETAKSKFNWHVEALTRETIITDSYKNTQNVRRFFRQEIGSDFKFTIGFMAWIKVNVGKSLEDAITEFYEQKRESSKPGFKTKIKPHNQFNQYTRDILAQDPTMSMKDVRRIWAKKRALPTSDGKHVFELEDLDLHDE